MRGTLCHVRHWRQFPNRRIIQIPEAETTVPADGQYFVRIRATNTSGQTQDAFDYYVTDAGKNYGMKCFYITGGQNVEEDIYEE